MSLGRLLATGKSLVGGQNSMGRYHLNNMGLPKFISPRNPFATEVKTEAASLRPVDAEPSPSLPKEAAVLTATAAPSRRAALFAWLGSARRRSSEWLGKANPFSRFGQSAKATKSAIPCFEKPPVQSELCLENVHVVRNDLSDADLEVVPVAPDRVKSDLVTADQCETAGKTCGRWTPWVFESTQT